MIKKKKPLISIIVPVYNSEKTITRCVDSLISQTYDNKEVILVDDGSTDQSGEISDALAEKYGYIRVIHKNNGGVYSSRKKGAEIAQGEYVGFIDADDWASPEMYEKLIETAVQYNVDMVVSGVVDENGTILKKRIPDYDEGLYEGEKLNNCVKTKMIDVTGYYEFKLMPYLCNKIFKTDIIRDYLTLDPLKMDRMNGIFPVWLAVLKSKSIYVSHKAFWHYVHTENSLKRKIYWHLGDYVRNSIEYWDSCFSPYGEMVQMHNYLKYFLLFREPWFFDDDKAVLRVYGGIEPNKRIIIYGAGAAGTILMSYLKSRECDVIAWVDTNYTAFSKEKGVISPYRIREYIFDYIILGITRYSASKEVHDNLLQMGIEETKIRTIDKEYLSEARIESFL